MPDVDDGSGTTASPKTNSRSSQDEPPRVFGRMRGKIRIADDFDAPLPDEILDQFESGPIFPRP